MGGKNRSLGHCAITAHNGKFSPRRSKVILLAAMGAVLAAPAAVHATSYSWNINASGLFDTGANWSPAGRRCTSICFSGPGTSHNFANGGCKAWITSRHQNGGPSPTEHRVIR